MVWGRWDYGPHEADGNSEAERSLLFAGRMHWYGLEAIAKSEVTKIAESHRSDSSPFEKYTKEELNGISKI